MGDGAIIALLYLGAGMVTNFLCMLSWRQSKDEWRRHWSDWLFVVHPIGLLVWPVVLPDEVASRFRDDDGGAS